jgi:hypothetical protein
VGGVSDETVQRALLCASLRGATRTDLRLAGWTASILATEQQVQRILHQLEADHLLEESRGRWTTTPAGCERLAELEAE